MCNNFASVIFNTLTNNLTYVTLDSTIIIKYYAILFDALAPKHFISTLQARKTINTLF